MSKTHQTQQVGGTTRLAGVNIPQNKPLFVALTYIYGIGTTTASAICKKAGISENLKVYQLSDEQSLAIKKIIEDDHDVEGELRREVQMNIKRKMDLGSYQGLRHRKGLPVRGQRTHTNARTRKGPAKAIAGKKKVG